MTYLFYGGTLCFVIVNEIGDIDRLDGLHFITAFCKSQSTLKRRTSSKYRFTKVSQKNQFAKIRSNKKGNSFIFTWKILWRILYLFINRLCNKKNKLPPTVTKIHSIKCFFLLRFSLHEQKGFPPIMAKDTIFIIFVVNCH